MNAPPRRVQRHTDGPAIAAARRSAGLTQAQLGERVGAGKQTISLIELEQREASVGLLARLTAALDVPLHPFLREPSPDELRSAHGAASGAAA